MPPRVLASAGEKILQNLLRAVSLGTLHDLYIRTTVSFGRVSQKGKKWRLQTNFHGFVYLVIVGMCKIFFFLWMKLKLKNEYSKFHAFSWFRF